MGAEVYAQGAVSGVVTSGVQPREPLANAEVVLLGLERRATTDTSGQFRLRAVPPGNHQLIVRASGYKPDTVVVHIVADEVIALTFALDPVTTALSPIRVETGAPISTARTPGFSERRKAGGGRFLDRSAIERWENQRTGDMLSTLAGLDVRKSITGKAWATSGRAVSPAKCAFCTERKDDVLDAADINAGAGVACYSDVYVDGAMTFNSTMRKVPLFDLNSIPTSQIEAVEFFPSAANLPAQFNRTSGGCGVLLIWTRIK